MSGLVLDASTALSWCFRDERTPGDMAVLERSSATHAAVPSVWPLELANALVRAEREVGGRHAIAKTASISELVARIESLIK